MQAHRYFLYFFTSAVFLTGCTIGTDVPSLRETFSKNDKNPFGTYVLHQQAGQYFLNNKINTKKKKFESTFKETDDTASLYICVSRNFYSGKNDNEAILEYAANGNSIFISSQNFDRALLDTLGVQQATENFFPVMRYTAVKTAPALVNDSTAYSFFYFPFLNYFNRFDSGHAKVLGLNEKSRVNYLLLFYGRGRIYLHCEPRALSNYFLLQKNNYRYMQQVFSLMRPVPERVFWDDYYNKRNTPSTSGGNRSGLSVLLQYPAMAWAFWLLFFLLTVYILFESKRRQRIVPVLPANSNTSMAFTETVGRLYLQKKDNKNLASKMITYFLEHIRNQYFLNTSHINKDFIDTLSKKTNASPDVLQPLFQTIQQVQGQEEVSDEQLFLLNGLIENFYKK